MRTHRYLIPACVFGLQTFAFAGLNQAITLTATVDGVPTSHRLVLIPAGGTLSEFNLNKEIDLMAGGKVAARLTGLAGLFDGDPGLTYGISVVDLGEPSTFSFTFTSPIVPTASPAIVRASFAGSVTEGGAGDGVSLTPTGPDGDGDGIAEMQSFSLQNGALVNAGLDIGEGFNMALGPFASGNVPAVNIGPTTAPNGVFEQLRIDLSFKLSGGGDVATLNGGASIEPVGVPDAGSTLMLLGLGCGALFVARGKSVAR